MDLKEKAKAVGHIPSGLFIVCSHSSNGDKDGYLASWIQQVSFNPLIVAVAIGPNRPGYEHIKSGGTFTINVVGEKNTQYLRHFWKGYPQGEGPFGDIDHSLSENQGIIIKDSLSTIECKMKDVICPGDHEIILAEVIGSYVQDENGKPKVHIRKSGLDY